LKWFVIGYKTTKDQRRSLVCVGAFSKLDHWCK